MPTLMSPDTRNALGPNAEKCDSRSLLFDRFVDPTAKEDARKQVFVRAMGKPPIRTKQNGWLPFLFNGLGLKSDDLLFGKLQARMMVNMAGGVMENAGLCLDRFGIPYIPGSAVKGCARRMAIQELYESAAGFQPANGPENIATKSQRLDRCAQSLAQIARVFGWGDLDWSGRPDQSDFRYACGDADWEEIRERAAKLLFAAFPNWKPDPKKSWWQSLPNYAGSVSFLPAYPVGSPPSPDLELDVVTCHHQKYYSQEKDRQGRIVMPVALDTEDPVPVVFPAVAPGHVFVFAVLGQDPTLSTKAKVWLQNGLEQFGLGTKTAAGYGWFEVEQTCVEQRKTFQEQIAIHLAAANRAQLQADPRVLDDLKTKNEGTLRGLVNQFQTDEKFWSNKDETFQLSLLVFCTETAPAIYDKEKANPKSKFLKALQNLAKKFGRSLP